MSYFKTLFTYLEDENVERISNKLENQFKKKHFLKLLNG